MFAIIWVGHKQVEKHLNTGHICLSEINFKNVVKYLFVAVEFTAHKHKYRTHSAEDILESLIITEIKSRIYYIVVWMWLVGKNVNFKTWDSRERVSDLAGEKGVFFTFGPVYIKYFIITLSLHRWLISLCCHMMLLNPSDLI